MLRDKLAGNGIIANMYAKRRFSKIWSLLSAYSWCFERQNHL